MREILVRILSCILPPAVATLDWYAQPCGSFAGLRVPFLERLYNCVARRSVINFLYASVSLYAFLVAWPTSDAAWERASPRWCGTLYLHELAARKAVLGWKVVLALPASLDLLQRIMIAHAHCMLNSMHQT